MPLVTFGALTAAIIAVFTIASGAIILIPTWLWSLGLISDIDSLLYKPVWWAFGHSSQQINVSAHVSVWYLIAAMLFGAKPLCERVSRSAFLLYILFLQLASAHHLLADPGLSSSWKIVNTSYVMYLAVLASMVHGLTVPGAIEVAQRRKGFDRGLFEWLRKAPWGNPFFSGMFISLIGFGFLGGISGVMMGTEQLNMIIHNTIYVPGHFHATVVVGTTLAFMALTYLLIPLLFEREMICPKLARLQPYLFGIGDAGFSLFMMGAGTLGVSRRHWDIAFTDAAWRSPIGRRLPDDGIDGIFAVIAAIGGTIYVLVVVGTVLFGKKIKGGHKLTFPLHSGGGARRRNTAAMARSSSRHLRPGRDLLYLLRPLLLHQLEISVGAVAVPVMALVMQQGNNMRATAAMAVSLAHSVLPLRASASAPVTSSTPFRLHGGFADRNRSARISVEGTARAGGRNRQQLVRGRAPAGAGMRARRRRRPAGRHRGAALRGDGAAVADRLHPEPRPRRWRRRRRLRGKRLLQPARGQVDRGALCRAARSLFARPRSPGADCESLGVRDRGAASRGGDRGLLGTDGPATAVAHAFSVAGEHRVGARQKS